MKRIISMMRDPELRWERRLVTAGAFVPGPLDEVVIYPLVLLSIFFRKRHVLRQHNVEGKHIVALLGFAVMAALIMGALGDVVLGVID